MRAKPKAVDGRPKNGRIEGVPEPEPIEVDARGLYCPLPILRLVAALRSHPVGTRARLIATDPIAVRDVEAFCGQGRGRLLSQSQSGGVLSFEIEKG